MAEIKKEEAMFHDAIKGFLGKREQGLVMGHFRAVLSANAGKVDADRPVIIGPDGIVWANIYFNWAQDKCGFGEWSCVVKDGEVKELLNEGMGPEWSRKALYAMSDALIEKLFPTQQAIDAGKV